MSQANSAMVEAQLYKHVGNNAATPRRTTLKGKLDCCFPVKIFSESDGFQLSRANVIYDRGD